MQLEDLEIKLKHKDEFWISNDTTWRYKKKRTKTQKHILNFQKQYLV